MKKYLFPIIIAISALAVSGSAAFYSVFGLSMLFAGASKQVIIMAGSLEFAKLVVASLLYQYWGTINKWLRTYLSIACLVLMVITSGGIYGFLSGAYQSTATKSKLHDKSLLILNQKQVRFEETKEDLTIEKTQINKSISDLRISLSSPTSVSYWDENSQTVITTSSSSARRALQTELKTTTLDRDNLNIKIEAVMDSINKTDMALLDKEVSNETESELGPLKYLAETTGKDMGVVVNWFLLLIIFVFDPLAIALVVASNMAFAQIRKPEEDYFVSRNKHIEKIMEIPQMKNGEEIGLVDVEKKKQTKKEIKIEPKDIVMDDMEDLERDERRMNIIGQNGNDGLHYEKVTPTSTELEILQNHLNNLKYYNDELYYENVYGGELDRITDTTQTLIVDKTEEEENEKRTLKYRKRK
jgi:hypothetical protein|tara:strand:- start:239 stop:1480 length:1242 start_codon:yes stop_codon:yes gene_type:complete